MYLKTILKKLNINYNLKNDYYILDVVRNIDDIKNDVIYVSYDDSYLSSAIKKGAKIIFGTNDYHNNNIIYIKVLNIKKTYSQLIDLFYHKYYKNITFIAVTGTNGKTTTSTLIYSFFKYNNIPSILIGSNGIFYGDVKYKTNNTTPDIKVIGNAIKEANKIGIKYAIIESSSIAISELRLYNIPFSYAILTNISQDHFDYHKNFEGYISAKGVLFTKATKAIINTDSEYYMYFDNLNNKVIYYGKNSSFPSNYELKKDHMNFTLNNTKYKTNLVGLFNLYNIMGFLTLIYDLGYSKASVISFLEGFKLVDGRMNMFFYKNRTIIIDFAHTPMAMKAVLDNVRLMHYNKIWCIFGAGGNRDKEKRKLMGEIVSKYSDNIVLTNDNPREENELDIIHDIGLGITKSYKVILDRKKAILEVLMLSKDNDCILILGKGNEDYIIKNGMKIKYSDIEFVKNIIGE